MVTRLTQPGSLHPHTVQDRGAQPLSLPLPLARRPAEPFPPRVSFAGGFAPSACTACGARLAAAHWHCRHCAWRNRTG